MVDKTINGFGDGTPNATDWLLLQQGDSASSPFARARLSSAMGASGAMSGVVASSMTVTAYNTPSSRTLARRAADWVNVCDGYGDAPGAVGDGVMCDAAVTVASGTPTVVTIAGQAFTSANIGNFISIEGIGAAGATHSTTIAAVNSATVVVLTAAASTFVTASSKRVVYGTDDAAALSAIKVAMLADRNGILLATYRPTGIFIPARTFIIVSTSVDFTRMHGFDVSAYGAVFYGATNGKAVVDGFGIYKSQIRGLTIIGDRGLPPNVGLQIGQYESSGANGGNGLYDLDVRGYFSVAAYYNRGSETSHHQKCTFDTSSANAYATIMDGINHFDLDSEHVDVTLNVDASMSASGNTFTNCRFLARGSGSNGLWTTNAKGQKFFPDNYINTLGKAFIFYNVSFRMESFTFHGAIDGPPTHFLFVERTSFTFVYDIDVKVHSTRANVALFGTSAVGGVCKLQGHIIYDDIPDGPLFDDISLFELNCDIVATHTGATPVLPAVMTGTLRVAESPTVIYNASILNTDAGGSQTINVESGGDSGTATPAGLVINDTSVGSGWDLVNPWGIVEFSSEENSYGGPGGRLRIAAVAEDSFGGRSRLGFFTAATVGTWVEQMALASSGALTLYAGSLGFVGGAGASAPANGVYIPASNTLGWSANSTQILTGTTSVIAVKPTTAATSNTTGALTVAGGLGVAGAVHAAAAQINGTSGGESGTATPFGLTIVDSSNGSSWDTANPWAKIEFSSADTTDGGPGGRLRIAAVAEDSFGGQSRLAIFTAATVGTWVERAAVASDGTFTVYGSIRASTAGYYVNGTQVIGSRGTGWTAMTGTPDESTSYATGSVTLAQLAGRVMALQTALTTHGLIGA